MIEAAILVIIASGLWMVTSQFKKYQHHALPLINNDDKRRSLSVITEGGLYILTSPMDASSMRAFRSLHLVEGGFKLQDNLSQQVHIVDFGTIQWVSAVTFSEEGIARISIHLEIRKHWRILSLQIPESDMTVLVKVLQQIVNVSRLNIGRPSANPIGPLAAYVTEDTLQGESNLGAEVSLYLLPHILIILQADIVRAKLDTSSIRRVLSVERISGRLDTLLNPTAPEGVVRLYSRHETVAFALPQFRELAEEISYLSRCPVEFITQEDKTGKI